MPGIAIAIAGPEGLRETAVAGYADLAAGQPASADMVCPRFSMTKIVTASLAMRLAGQGLLGLDQPVLPLVPELAVMQPRALAERIIGIIIMGNVTNYLGSPEPSGLRTSSRVRPEGLGVNGRQEKELHA